jgi:hypothetical protein
VGLQNPGGSNPQKLCDVFVLRIAAPGDFWSETIPGAMRRVAKGEETAKYLAFAGVLKPRCQCT